MGKSIFQFAYDNEINVAVSSFWDCGFRVRLGDDLNGYTAEATVKSWAEVEAWLKRAIETRQPAPAPARSAQEIERFARDQLGIEPDQTTR